MRRYTLVGSYYDGSGSNMKHTLSVNYETLSWVKENLQSGRHYSYAKDEKHIVVTDNAMTAIALACSIN